MTIRSSICRFGAGSMRAMPAGPATEDDRLRPGPVFWLEQALTAEADQGDTCPPLTGTQRFDVCIVGGGYTGLWTAIELRALAPDLSVAVVEAEGCGFGASGRNGGWMTSWYDEVGDLAHKFGEHDGLWLADESSRTIGRIGEFAAEHGIECDYRQEGTVWIASAAAQRPGIDAVIEDCKRLGRGDRVEPLSADQVIERTGTRVSHGGVFIRDSASVQPALLARGLRRVALRRGVRIFEGSPMVRLERTRPAAVVTPAGRIEADQVVIATNAWAARLRELRRAIVVVGTQIVLTEPIPDRLAGIDWSRGALLGDARLFVHYAQITADGRIAFGRGGGALGPFGRVVPRHMADPRMTRVVAADFRKWFPELRDVRLTHAWGGAVDRAPGHLPFVGALGDHGNVHYGVGYSGNGVGPSALIGRILARRALGTRDEYTSCALVSGPPGYLPPEPLRFLGGVLVRGAVQRGEAREEAGRPATPVERLAKRLVYFSTKPPRRVRNDSW
jgi:glycine/D-amino acid oxidase-like deaminating enzyme